MAIREKALEAWSELKQKIQDKKNQERVAEEIKKRLKQGVEAIDRVEKKLRDPKTQAKMQNKIREAREKLKKAKAEFNKKRAQTAAYAKNNPEKALVVAAAAGAMAVAIWSAFHRKK